MDALCRNYIRVRLHFDYPPPSVVDLRMFCVLVDLNKCRLVSDLESTIRDKFEYSSQSMINLFIEDCYLLHTESIHVVRENDLLRVKVECVSHLDADRQITKTTKHCKRRRRSSFSEPNNGENVTSFELGGEIIKETHQKVLKKDTNKSICIETEYKVSKKKRKKVKATGVTATDPPTLSTPQNHKSNQNSKTDISQQSKSQTSTLSDSSKHKSVEYEVPIQTGTKRDSSICAKGKHLSQVLPSTHAVTNRSLSSSSDIESSNETVTDIVKHKNHDNNDLTNLKSSFNHNFSTELLNGGPKKQSSVSVTSLNKIPKCQVSCDINNGNKAKVVTLQSMQQSPGNQAERDLQDYSAMPLLAAPPQVGQKIAFKQLELTENYTPEVSSYKEAIIVSFDSITKQIELELLSATQA
ncbi:coilin isoform X2 [Stigmatopora nigra]